MKPVLICDRCGSHYKREVFTLPKIAVVLYNNNPSEKNNTYFDLCDNCIEDLCAFLRGAGVDSSEKYRDDIQEPQD